MGFAVGGVQATVEPDFKGFGRMVRAELTRLERDLVMNVKIVPDVGRGFKRDLERQVRTITSGSAVAIPVEFQVSKTALRRAETEAKRFTSGIVLGVDINESELVSAATKAVAKASASVPPLQLRFDLDPSVLVADATRAITTAEPKLPKIDIGVDIDSTAVVAQAKAASTAAGAVIRDSPDLKNSFKNALSSAGNATLGAAKTVGKTIALGVAGGVVAAGGAFAVGFNNISDIGESVSKLQVLLGDASSDVVAFADTTAAKLGISKSASLEAAGAFANLANSANLSGPAAADFSTSLVSLSGDLASFSNLQPEDVLQKLQSGLVGETEPLRALGVFLNEATVQAKGLELGLGDANGVLTDGEKIQARYAAILEQTTKAQGDFARTAASVPNQIRALKAEALDASAALAEGLLPTGATLLKSVRGLIEPVSAAITPIGESIASVLTPLIEKVGPLLPALGKGIAVVVAGVGEIVAGIPAGAFDAIGFAIQAFAEALSSVDVGVIGESIGGVITVIANVAGALAPLAPVFVGLVDAGLQFINAVIEPLSFALEPVISALADGLGGALDALGPVLSTIGGQLGDTFAQILLYLGPIAEQLLPVLGQAFGSVLKALSPLIPVLGDLIVGLIQQLGPVLPGIVELLGKLASTSLGAFVDVLAALAPILLDIAPLLVIVVDIFAELLAQNTGVFAELLKALVPLFDALGQVVKAVAPILGKFLKAFTPVIVALSNTALLEAVVPLITGIANALSLLVKGDFSGAFKALASGFVGMFKALQESASKIGDFLGPILVSIGEWVTGTAVPSLAAKGVELLGALWGWISDAIPWVIEQALGLVSALGAWIVGTAVPWLAGQALSLTSALLGWIADAAVKLPLQLLEWLLQFGAWLAFTAVPWLLEKGVELAASFTAWITDVIMSLPSKLAGWVTAIGSWIVFTAVPWLIEKGRDLASSFTSWITDVVTSLPGKLASIATSILDFLKTLPAKVSEGAKSVGSAIWDGIVSGLSAAGGAVASIASKIWDGLKGFINEHLIRPLKEFEVPVFGRPLSGIPYLAEGAVVTSPTVAVIGEAGPELVLPLSDPARMQQLIADATGAGLLPASTPVTGAGVAASTGSTTSAAAAASPSLTAEMVQEWADEITAIMVALPTNVTELTVPLWEKWVATLDFMMLSWSQRFTLLWTNTWSKAQFTMVNATNAMSTQLSSGLAAMETIAITGAERIGTALNNGLTAAVNTATLKVQEYGTKLAAAINPVLLAIGEKPVVLQFAEGGYVPGPRVREDIVPAMLMPGEFVLKRDVVDRIGRDRLRAVNSGQVQRFANGGDVLPAEAVSRAQSFARAQAGKPYVWGADGPDGFDCSGFWSAIINTIREPGRTPYRRLFNTKSLIDGGWRNVGMLPGTGQVSVGAYKGNPGHMAGTIAGLNAESRGSKGVLVGPSARSATDRLFTNQYHLGNGLYLGGDGQVYQLPDPFKLGKGVINQTGEAYMRFVHAASKRFVDKNTYTSNITAGDIMTEPGVSLVSGWLPASRGKISEFGGPGDINSLAVTGGKTSNPPLGPYYAAMRWQTRNYSALKNNRLMATVPRTGRSVVMYPGDWGPAQWTGRVLDISPAAMRALGATTDDVADIRAVSSGTRLGPVPVLHDGGVYENAWRGEGLALLEHGERVIPKQDAGVVTPEMGAMFERLVDAYNRGGGSGDTVNVTVQSPPNVDPNHWGRTAAMRLRREMGGV